MPPKTQDPPAYIVVVHSVQPINFGIWQPVLGFTNLEGKKEGKRTEHKLWPTSSIELAIGCAARP